MGYEIFGVCQLCGTEFEKTMQCKKYCSRRCANIAANRRKRIRSRENRERIDTECPHNKALVCTNRNCESCGWNPVVAKKRSASYGAR